MPRTINLDALVADDGGAITVNGTEHRVLPVQMATYATYQQAVTAGDPEKATAAVLAVVRKVVPSFSEADIASLSIRQVNAIIDLAMTGTVEEPDPNGTGASPATSPQPSTSPA